ncbi:hypothetical protein RHGRI_017792 [Rhododendron griersonianum]|uniref:F-box domain-containing protein n=1 Tax=Rhododendron griersonianum TaxID=479676 RepID=A0AAV6JZ58_9ERIC|nr:hypothetical protein RHGRI_017792 [Rhododendron griersonianum]
MEGTKRKRKKMEDHDVVEKRDCLAELPEPLLHHILSYLTMKDVIRTSVLAKRWRYTWLYVPCLTFPALKKTRSEEVAFINKSLLVHKGSKVQKLDITFKYHTEAGLVDSWIQFALTRNVNQLYLDFRGCHSLKSKYTLHDTIFRCRSLTVLSVKRCMIKFPVKIKLGSLKTLSFEEVNFDVGAINNLLSSCSILEELSFTACNFANNPDLVIMNSGVKTLKIREENYSRNLTTVEIDAPFILSLESEGIFSKRYVIKRMESLRSVSFVCSKTCWELCSHFTNLENLAYLCHVKDLRMCSCYIQAISSTENQTQDCREKHVIDLISFDVTCLWIKAGLIKSELPGIAYILSHSPNVETLIISIDKIRGEEDTNNFRENEYWKLQEPKFVNLLCNLKDVKIYNFMKNVRLLDSKPMSTTDDFLAHLRNDMNFLRFLLKNSKALEKMTVTTIKKVNFGRNSKSKKRMLLFQLTQELQAFPRASQAAQISFN